METLISNNIVVPNKLDSIRIQNNTDFQELRTAIVGSSKSEQIISWVSNDTVFTVSTMLIVFILGLSINLLVKKIDKWKNNRKIREYFKHHLDKVKDQFSVRIIEEYRNFYLNLSIDTGITTTPPKILSGDFQRIKNIDSSELFHAISKKKELSNILSQIDYFDKIIDEVEHFHSHTLTDSNRLRIRINDLLNRYMDLLIEFIEFERNNTPNYQTSDNYNFINNSILKFYQGIAGKRALVIFYHKVLRPNQEFLVKTQLYRTHEIGNKIASVGKDLSYAYNDLKQLTVEFKLQYRKFSKYLEVSRKSLINNMDKINWG